MQTVVGRLALGLILTGTLVSNSHAADGLEAMRSELSAEIRAAVTTQLHDDLAAGRLSLGRVPEKGDYTHSGATPLVEIIPPRVRLPLVLFPDSTL